ncbi:MAG: DMT family transporter [Rhodobacteraceae bacterium]|nr:DMT family transporter [Paracoccaceae bacterium]
MPATISLRAWIELALLAFLWGASFLSIRIALDEIGPLTAVAHRTLWAAVLLWGVVWLQGVPIPLAPRVWGAFLVMGLLNNVIPFGLMAWGQLHISSGLTSVLNAATAIWGVLIAALFFADERLTLRKLIGVGLGFLGVIFAVGPGSIVGFSLQNLAQLAVIAGTLSYALASVWARKTLVGLAPHCAAAGMLSAATLIALPLAWVFEGQPRLWLAPLTWGAIAYYALGATALAYLLYYRVLKMAGAGNLMLVTLMIPPIAIVLGAWVRGETLAPLAWLGLGVLALGFAVLDGRPLRMIQAKRMK